MNDGGKDEVQKQLDYIRDMVDQAKKVDDPKYAVRYAALALQAIKYPLILNAEEPLSVIEEKYTQNVEGSPNNDYLRLRYYITVFEQAVPLDLQDTGDFDCLFLPNDLKRKLCDAIYALEHGDTHPIIRPHTRTGRTKSWTERQLILRACMHVRFKYGRGMREGDARHRVARHVPMTEDGIKQWTNAFKEDHAEGQYLVLSYEAGKLQAEIDDDPEYERDNYEHLSNYNISYFRRDLMNDHLADLGRRLRECQRGDRA